MSRSKAKRVDLRHSTYDRRLGCLHCMCVAKVPKVWRLVLLSVPTPPAVGSLSTLTLPRPHFPSAVRDCSRRSKPFRYFCQQACQHFKLETCLPGFEIFHLKQIFDGDFFGGGGRGKLFKNKYNSWFPYPCCCRASFSVWFQLISL